MRLQHKDGKIIDAPKAGVAALLALGWEPIDPPQDQPPASGGQEPETDDDTADQGDGEENAEAESEDGEAKAKPAAQKRGGRRQVPKPGDDA